MPQLQSITLTDRASGGAQSHVFNPRDIVAGVGSVVESTGVPVGESVLTVSHRKAGARHIAEVRLTVPVVATETINGIGRPMVVRTSYANLRFSFDDRSTTQERDDVVGMLVSALGASQTLVNDAVVGLEGVY